MAKNSFKLTLCGRYLLPQYHWYVKDYNEDAHLALLRDQLFDILSGIVPQRYQFAKGSVFDIHTLHCVCKPLKQHQTFVIPSFPENRVTIYTPKTRTQNTPSSVSTRRPTSSS